MMLDKNRALRLLLCLAGLLLLVELAWMRAGSFFGLALVSMAGVWAVAWSLKPSRPGSWPVPEAQAPAVPSQALRPSPGGTAATILGFALLGLALVAALNGQLAVTLGCLLGAAACWRPLLSLRPQAALSRRWVAILMALAMAAGAAFRFSSAGEIPQGMITVDEPRLMVLGLEVANGKRSTFVEEGSEGNAPLWVEGAALWLFGKDITGFRMSALLPGLMVVGLIGLLGLELAGSRAGLMAAAFSAVSVWPVSFSRAEYLVCSSFIPIIAAPWLLLSGLRRGSPLALAAGGFFLGLSFNIYSPGRLVPPLMLLLVALIWLRQPRWRQSLQWSLWPLLGGLVVGLAPLLLWASRNPIKAYGQYFGKLNYDLIAGANVVHTQGLLNKFDLTFGRILPNLPRVISMFSDHGGMRPWFFKVDQPIIDQATLFLLLAGMATCLIRFRQPAFAFILSWWPIGLVPTLLADPAYHMDERRIMLNMPATLVIAAIGLNSSLSLLSRGLSRKWADAWTLAASLTFFAVLGAVNWHTYFSGINMDRAYQDATHANFDNMLRGIFRQEHKSPVTVISFRKPNDDNWWGSNPENELEEHFGVLGAIPRTVACTGASYLQAGGLFGSLRSLASSPGKPDPLIVLTPFHFYLEPLLLQLGGQRVEDIAPAVANDGPNFHDVGFAWDKSTATRLVRLKDFDPAKLDGLEKRWSFPYTVEELQPPAGLGTRESLSHIWLLDPKSIQAIKSYDSQPQRWQVAKRSSFSLPDAWFWITANNFPGKLELPLRLRASWTLTIPADGSYSLGASSNLYVALRLDGKKVYSYLPQTRDEAEAGREGSLGAPLQLKAGPHRLDIDQVAFSASGNFNHLLRLLWQKPGGEKETLPIEQLLPEPPQR